MIPRYFTSASERSISFTFPNQNDPILTHLKQIAELPPIAETAIISKALSIAGFAHRLFDHNGDQVPSASDPVTIYTEALSGKSFRCVEYSILAAALLTAYGIPARLIGLKTSDVETRTYGAGHVVIEFWDDDLQKWVMCDVQAGIVPMSDSHALSAVEFGMAVHQKTPLGYSLVHGSRFALPGSFGDLPAYIQWVHEYLFFFDTPRAMTFENIDRKTQPIVMLVPLGVASPKMFQGMFTMNAIYTHSVVDFYPYPAQ